jgi:protein-disulfide isomerase
MSDAGQKPDQSRAAPTGASVMSMRATVMAVALAFGVGLSAGRYVASASERSAVDDGGAEALGNSSVIYKIPVSLSQPKQGPEDALVTLVQWCDFPDPACAKVEPIVQDLLKRYPTQVRIAFRNYVSDTRRDSAPAHQFSRIAFERGKFWEARALLLKHAGEIKETDLEHIATQIDLDWPSTKKALESGNFAGQVAADRIFASMFEVTEPGAFFVNGKPIGKEFGARALESLVKSEIARAQQLIAGGAAKKEIYATLIKDGTWKPPLAMAKKP